MKISTAIESLRFIRSIVGFVRAGVFAQPALTDRAARLAEQFSTEKIENDDPVDLPRTRNILATVQASIMPSQAACSASMDEIDAILIPLRQTQRAAQTTSPEASKTQSESEAIAANKMVERG